MNWRDITDLQQLDILTAQRLGYTVRSFERDKGAVWELYAPNGFQVGDGSYASERAAWRMGCPDYTSDLNAAAGLLPDNTDLDIRMVGDSVTVKRRILAPRFVDLPYVAVNDKAYAFMGDDYVERPSSPNWTPLQRLCIALVISWHALMDERERGK